ncbi:exopolysaccharide biosynthesis protein [Marinibaculum pumilum]|uniref:Exopolysaccharide biosynthesis protein n=1 Tax=Marinibaculum pumilum TaxID=1766165 RepID=A0ABV7L7A8_9PROT
MDAASDIPGHRPTSEVLFALLDGAPAERVSVGWLIASLKDRSFGIVMLLMGLVALVPGASTFIGLLLAIPAIQMILARRGPVFPAFIARRTVSTARLAWLIARIGPVLRWLERLIRPRWSTPFEATKRIIGGVLLLLGLLLLSPLPFSHVVPALVIVLMSFAYLEEDGVALCIALVAALATFAFVGATVWATVKGIDFLDPAALPAVTPGA